MVSVPEHTMDEIPLQEEEHSTEYRVLMAYAQRSLSASKFMALQRAISSKGDDTTVSKETEEKANGEAKISDSKHKKKGWPSKLTPACLRLPKTKKNKVAGVQENAKSPEEERVTRIVSRMQRIVQRIKKQEKEQVEGRFRMICRASSIQHDGDVKDEDEIIASIVEILRNTGDRLNEQMTEEKTLIDRMKEFWSYDFYKKLQDCFLSETVPMSATEEEQQTDRIAMCLHATAALTTLDNQPMNKVLGFGARYLKENYSPWIQSQGGWDKVMGIQEDEEEEVE
ncbi:apoptosis facilitator Bcl-2-like protein 14 [Pyxicephalus adspersus]|uniref:apoptosis facilitator Bcl-2-like protein 14 n=1 Tax=Pyxicephalus adspersus TaxID=30357 RepID=UPI003B5BCA9D